MKKNANKPSLLSIYRQIESDSKALSAYIHGLSPSDCHICAISLPIEGKDYRSLAGIELEQAIDIFTQFKAKLDQDPSRPLRLPGVIQITNQHKLHITALINSINAAKVEFDLQYKEMTKGLEARERSRRVHDALGSKSFITLQITRKITFIEGDIAYLGISYHKKPNIVSLSRSEVLNRLGLLSDRPMEGYSDSEWRHTIKHHRERIELLDEQQYQFRFTKGSYYRPMVNVKFSDGRDKQPSASIPVIFFTDDFVKVNLPRRHDNSKRRSDRVFDPESPNLSFANIHIRKVNNATA